MVTLWPVVDGLGEVAKVVVVVSRFTTCEIAAEVLGASVAEPA
jgi:hypothetical protein